MIDRLYIHLDPGGRCATQMGPDPGTQPPLLHVDLETGQTVQTHKRQYYTERETRHLERERGTAVRVRHKQTSDWRGDVVVYRIQQDSEY